MIWKQGYGFFMETLQGFSLQSCIFFLFANSEKKYECQNRRTKLFPPNYSPPPQKGLEVIKYYQQIFKLYQVLLICLQIRTLASFMIFQQCARYVVQLYGLNIMVTSPSYSRKSQASCCSYLFVRDAYRKSTNLNTLFQAYTKQYRKSTSQNALFQAYTNQDQTLHSVGCTQYISIHGRYS